MNIYTGPVFEMARQQFQVIADYVGIAEDELWRIRRQHRFTPHAWR